MKTPLLLATFIGVASTFAQQAAPSPSVPPLPPGPLLNRAPASSRWTVVTAGATAKQPAGHATAGAEKPLPQQVTYTKSGSIVLEESPGKQVWHLTNMRATIYAGHPLPVLTPDSGGSDLYTVDFARADFAGLDWISPQSYKGVAVQNGRKCLVFQGEVTPWTPLEMHQLESLASDAAILARFNAFKASGKETSPSFHFDQSTILVPATAYIDLETRLPILLLFGKDNSQKREYIYQATPPAPLTLPPVLTQLAAQQQQRVNDLSRAPSPP